MQIDNLKQLDSSLNIIRISNDDLKLEGISPADYPVDKTIVLVRTQRFADKLEKSFSNNSESILVAVEEKCFNALRNQEWFDKNIKNLCTVKSVDQSMCLWSEDFFKKKYDHLNYQVDGRQMGTTEIDPSAQISQNVFIGENVTIGKDVIIMPGVVILPEVIIGDNCVINPNVTIYPYTQIGVNTRINASTTIGADGFGYNFIDGEHKKIWHFSGVKIGNNVEIGAGTNIDAGAFTPTEIGDGTKIDNGCQIAHNAKIGKHCILCGKAGIAGSVVLEDYVIFGGGAGAAPGAHLGKGVQMAAYAVASENSKWPAGTKLAGHPARPLSEWLRAQAKLKGL